MERKENDYRKICFYCASVYEEKDKEILTCPVCGKTILPPMGAVAAIATFVGMPTAFLNPTKRHLWASFGIYNK